MRAIGPFVLAIGVYLAVEVAITLIGIGIGIGNGQVVPRLGVPFAALASYLWTSYSVSRAIKLNRTR